MKNRSKWMTVGLALLALAVCFWWKAPAIFQRGDPRPYLLASLRLGDSTPFAVVEEPANCTTYLTRAGDMEGQQALLTHLEQQMQAEMVEQGGSVYLFEGPDRAFPVETEVWWGGWLVWEVPTAENEVWIWK